jgi:hypothetical protein
VRREPDRHINRDKAGLLGRSKNISKPRQHTNPNVAVARINECRNPSGSAAIHSGQPLRRHEAFSKLYW